MRTLSPLQRKVISKKYFEGTWHYIKKSKRSRQKIKRWTQKTNVQIANELRIHEAVVGKTLKSGLKNLHEFLGSLKNSNEIFEEYSHLRFGFPLPIEKIFTIS